jgi:hypothetical protein
MLILERSGSDVYASNVVVGERWLAVERACAPGAESSQAAKGRDRHAKSMVDGGSVGCGVRSVCRGAEQRQFYADGA